MPRGIQPRSGPQCLHVSWGRVPCGGVPTAGGHPGRGTSVACTGPSPPAGQLLGPATQGASPPTPAGSSAQHPRPLQMVFFLMGSGDGLSFLKVEGFDGKAQWEHSPDTHMVLAVA